VPVFDCSPPLLLGSFSTAQIHPKSQTGDANYFDRAFFENPGQTKRGMIRPGLIWLSQYELKTVGNLPKQWVGNGINPVAILQVESNDFHLSSKGGKAQLNILTPRNLHISVTSFDPPPLEIGKTIPNLKRVEVIIPAHTLQNNKGKLTVRFAEE
jgi:hypothetical protein